MSFRIARPFLRSLLAAKSVAPTRRALLRPIPAQAPRHFSITSARFGSGESDSVLSAALASEQKYEVDAAKEGSEIPEFLEAMRSQGVWTVEDIQGNDDVVLTRKFGGESIRLTFQISDLEDPSSNSMTDDEGNQLELAEEEEISTPPFITCALLITKPAFPSAMSVDLEAGEEGFGITNVAMFEKSVGEGKGAEGDHIRRSKYVGPHFEQLDQVVQDSFTAFLDERGVDEALASFVLQYTEYKEQKDYLNWLKQVKGFVEA